MPDSAHTERAKSRPVLWDDPGAGSDHAGGGPVIYAASPLQRHFRDVHVAVQHAMVGADVLETIGGVLLGSEVDTGRL